jgi:hypothetical protein
MKTVTLKSDKLKSGVALIEFALIAPLAVFMLAASLEVGRVQVVSALLESSAYDIAYRAKVARGEGFASIVAQTLESSSHGLFNPEEVSVQAVSSEDLRQIVIGGGQAGAGEPGDVVHLQLVANIGVLGGLVPEPLRIVRTIDYYYVNEPDVEEEP